MMKLQLCLVYFAAFISVLVVTDVVGGPNLGLPLAFPNIPFDKCIVSAAEDSNTDLAVVSWGYNNEYWMIKRTSNSFGNWKSIGGVFSGGPTTIRNANNHLAVFGRGSDKQVYYKTVPEGLDESTWTSIGGKVSSGRVAAVLDSQGLIYIFARGQDNTVWQINQISNGTEALWGQWISHSGLVSGEVSTIIDSEGIINLFVRGINGYLWHKNQKLDVNGTLKWSEWQQLDKSVLLSASATISPKLNSQNLLEVVVRGFDKSFWLVKQIVDPEKGVSWSRLVSLGGIFSSAPFIESNLDGVLTVVGRGPENGVWQKQQLVNVELGSWSQWTPVGGRFDSSINILSDYRGYMNVFGCSVDDSIWVKSQSYVNNSIGFFDNWSNLGGRFRVFPC